MVANCASLIKLVSAWWGFSRFCVRAHLPTGKKKSSNQYYFAGMLLMHPGLSGAQDNRYSEADRVLWNIYRWTVQLKMVLKHSCCTFTFTCLHDFWSPCKHVNQTEITHPRSNFSKLDLNWSQRSAHAPGHWPVSHPWHEYVLGSRDKRRKKTMMKVLLQYILCNVQCKRVIYVFTIRCAACVALCNLFGMTCNRSAGWRSSSN